MGALDDVDGHRLRLRRLELREAWLRPTLLDIPGQINGVGTGGDLASLSIPAASGTASTGTVVHLSVTAGTVAGVNAAHELAEMVGSELLTRAMLKTR